MGPLDDVIDLDRYPLDRPDHAGYRATVDAARQGLAVDGVR